MKRLSDNLADGNVTPVSVHKCELVQVEDDSTGLAQAVLSGVLGESGLFFFGR